LNDIKQQVAQLSRRELEDIVIAAAANPSLQLLSLISSPSTATALTRNDSNDDGISGGIAKWTAYERKMKQAFDKPRHDACPCQCHKVLFK
jgi:hypothetical protein